MKKIFSVYLILFLAACQPVQVNDSSHITVEEIVTALQNKDVNLVDAEFKENVLGSKLGDVKPSTYELTRKTIFHLQI